MKIHPLDPNLLFSASKGRRSYGAVAFELVLFRLRPEAVEYKDSDLCGYIWWRGGT